MIISDPIQINDWEIKRFLIIILFLQTVFLGVVGLSIIGLNIPLLRGIVSILYLIFVPGILLLRIFRLHNLGAIRTLIYTVGLSIAVLMLMGLTINLVYPAIGISNPISIFPLITTISSIVLLFCFLSYKIDKNFYKPSYIDLDNFRLAPILLLCIIPFLAILGTYLMNFYQSNILLMFMLALIMVVVLLVGFDRIITKNLYPFTIFIISISLLYQRSLISMYITGFDIHTELYFSKLVVQNALWYLDINNNINAMLSIVILAPVTSIISNINLIWIFKIVYPLLYSIVPLGLYYIFKKMTSDKIAFLSVFFFMSYSIFFTSMLHLARQQIAELFLVILILTIIQDKQKINSTLIIIMSSFMIIVSHYGVSYIYAFILLSAYLLIVVVNKTNLNRFNKIKSITHKNQEKDSGANISINFILFFFIIMIFWYIYISGGSLLTTITHIGNQIITGINSDILKPDSAEGLTLLTGEIQLFFLGKMNSIVNYLNQLFIVIGVLGVLIYRNSFGNRFSKFFRALAVINLVILVMSVFLPFFSSALGTTRVYHLTLIVLAPFCVVGGLMFIKILTRILKRNYNQKVFNNGLKILFIYFVVFFAYQTDFANVVIGADANSISLNSHLDFPIYNNEEINAAEWISTYKDNRMVYPDMNRASLLRGFGVAPIQIITDRLDKISENSYIFLGTLNIENNQILVKSTKGASYETIYEPYQTLIENRRLIFDDGAQIYM